MGCGGCACGGGSGVRIADQAAATEADLTVNAAHVFAVLGGAIAGIVNQLHHAEILNGRAFADRLVGCFEQGDASAAAAAEMLRDAIHSGLDAAESAHQLVPKLHLVQTDSVA